MNTNIENIIKIAKAAKLDSELAAVAKLREEMKTAPFRVYVCGEVYGKNSFLQKLLDTDAPFSGSSRIKATDIEICYAEQDACYCAGQKVEFSVMHEGYELPSAPSFQLNCELLKNTGAVMHVSSPESSPLYAEDCESIVQALGVVDCCIYVLNSTHAWSRGDVRVVNLFLQSNIPVFVTATHFDQIDEEEREDLLIYMKRMTPTSSLITTDWDDLTGGATVLSAREFIQDARANLVNQREQIVQAAYRGILIRSVESLEKQLSDIDNKYEEVEKIDRTKERDRMAQIDAWRHLKDQLDENKNKLKTEVVQITQKGMERCSDRLLTIFKSCQQGERKLKGFCEEIIPYELKNHLSDTKDKVEAYINRYIQQTCIQLEKNLQKLTGNISSGKVYMPVDMKVEVSADTPHLRTGGDDRLKLRLGRGIKYLGAGVALVGLALSNPIAGVSGAAVLLPGVVNDFIDWLKSGDKDKDLQSVQDHIQNMVEKNRLALEQEAYKVIDEQYENIIAIVDEQKEEWESRAVKERQEEKKIAHYNIQKKKESIEQLLLEAKTL